MDKMTKVESYLNRGWGLTPVGAPKDGDKNSGKNPFLKGWPQNPVKDLESAKTYWDNDKGYNVGILTGEASGLVVLDIDEPEVFEKFLEKHPECRNTYIVRRNNAEPWKCHYYFKLDGLTPSSHNVKKTGWGDLMSNGKQVVAPPSVHYTGGIYEVINDVEPLPFKEEYMADLLLSKVQEGKPESLPAVQEVTPEPLPKGADEGTRNSKIFNMACEMRDSGAPQEEADDAARDFCRKCDPPYDEAEALRTVASAYGRNPKTKRRRYLMKLNYEYEKTAGSDGDKPKYDAKPLSYDRVTERITKLLWGKVANVYDELIVLPLEVQSSLQVIKTQADLFSYLGNEYQDTPDWKKGSDFMSKEEILSSIKETVQKFDAIEYVPHYPPIKEVYYRIPELPPPNDAIINQLLDFFSPETPEDRSLILAMFMTVLWGGAPGQRAPFAITSKKGRGVGKSTLAETAAKIVGQSPLQASTKDKAQALITRLLSSGAGQKRVIMFDNETASGSRITNGEIAALFTLEEISGHKLYTAESSRKNNLVWIMTMNSPSFDSDFASRCISISLKRPVYDSSWKTRLNHFLGKHQLEIISTLLSYLMQEGKSFKSTSRWGSWEAEVLAKVPGINFEKVSALLRERRENNDNEQDELELIVDGLRNCLWDNGHDLDTEKVFIRNCVMADIVKDTTDMKWGKGNLLKLANLLVDKGTVKELSSHRHRHWGGGFLWSGAKSGSSPMILLGSKEMLSE